MNYIDEERVPELWTAGNFVLAAALHLALFALCALLSLPLRTKEAVIPIELTFEAPPEEVAPAPEPKAVPRPEPKPEPPPVVKDPKVDAVEKVYEKPKPPKPKPKAEPKPEPKPEPPKAEPKPEPKPEPPKKTAKELREEKLRKMRDNATVVRNPRPRPPVVGTGRNLEKEWEKLAKLGYRAGATTQLAADESQRCLSLIKRAFYEKWERPAWTSSLRKMVLEVTFGGGGKVTGYRLMSGSGDAKADRSVLSAASRVGSVSGLSSEFLSANRTVLVNFEVTP